MIDPVPEIGHVRDLVSELFMTSSFFQTAALLAEAEKSRDD